MSKIIISGATGFVGSNLAIRLAKTKNQLHILARQTSNFWRLNEIKPKLKLHLIDLTNKDGLQKVVSKIKPDIVFHLANSGLYGGKSANAKELVEVNTIGTLNMIQAALNSGVRFFVNSGSSSEYGPKKDPMREDDICRPTTVYGVTKLAATLLTSMFAKTSTMPLVTLRLFSPYGPFNDKSRLISYVTSSALRNQPLQLSSATSVRDYIFIDDVTNAYLKFLEFPKIKSGEIINIGSGKQSTVEPIVKKIIKITSSKSSINWNVQSERPQESLVWQADITKAKEILNWQPKTSIDEGLEKTVAWFKSNLKHY